MLPSELLGIFPDENHMKTTIYHDRRGLTGASLPHVILLYIYKREIHPLELVTEEN